MWGTEGAALAFIRFLKREHVRVQVEAKSKDDLLAVLSSLAGESGLGGGREVLYRKLLERERTMSTGIGNGVAVPHTLLEGIQELQAWVLTLRQPIAFDAVDGQPVAVVFGLFGDPAHPDVSLGTLATLGRILRDEPFVRSLREAKDRDEVYRLLEEKEVQKGS